MSIKESYYTCLQNEQINDNCVLICPNKILHCIILKWSIFSVILAVLWHTFFSSIMFVTAIQIQFSAYWGKSHLMVCSKMNRHLGETHNLRLCSIHPLSTYFSLPVQVFYLILSISSLTWFKFICWCFNLIIVVNIFRHLPNLHDVIFRNTAYNPWVIGVPWEVRNLDRRISKGIVW